MTPSILDTLFDNAPVGFVYFDADLCIRHVNRRAQAQFAPAGGELIDRTVAALGLTDIDEALLHQALAGANVVRLLRVPGVAGDCYLDVICSSLPDGEGWPGVLLTAIDVTAREQERQQQTAHSEELQAVLDNLSEGVWLIEPNGNQRYRNPAGRRLLGISDDQPDLIVDDYARLDTHYPDGRAVPPPELPRFRAARGEAVTGMEMYLTGLDGVRRLLKVDTNAVRDAKGNVRLGFNLIRDITGQREIERQIDNLLLQSEAEQQRLFSVIDQMPEGVMIITAPSGGLLAMNKTARDLLTVETLDLTTGSTSYETLQVSGPDDSYWPPATWPIARALRGETVIAVQLKVVRQEGQKVDLLVNASPIYDRSGGREVISGAIGIFQDITELKELDRLKDDFISITSHELRTPLTTIKGYAQVITRKLARLDPQDSARAALQKPIDTILERTERMIAMINDLLDVSRITTGRLEVAGRAIDLSSLVTRCVEQARLTSPLPFALQTPDELILAMGEDRLVEQVLNNLLANAVKYSQSGNISVTLARDEQHAIVQVRDEGIGILPEQQEHLFERFYRAERSKGMASGLGLGLYISHSIITAHGGRLWVASDGPGHGSTFCFTLPLVGG